MRDMRIVWRVADAGQEPRMPVGHLVITVPVEPPVEGEPEADYLERIAARAEQDLPPGCVRVGVVHKTALPNADPAMAVPVEDWALDEAALAVRKAAVPDPVRHHRGEWRWDDAAGRVVVDPDLARAARWKRVRAIRDRLLDASDREWMRLTEVGSPADVEALRAYRQALRDLPAQTADPLAVVWPERQ
jgi:hypothetical protein